MDISEVVLKTLASTGKAMKSAEIAEKAGVDKADVDKAIKKLKAEEKIFSPKVCFYDLKR